MSHTIVLIKLFSNRCSDYIAARTTLYLLFTSSTDVSPRHMSQKRLAIHSLEKWMVNQLINSSLLQMLK